MSCVNIKPTGASIQQLSTTIPTHDHADTFTRRKTFPLGRSSVRHYNIPLSWVKFNSIVDKFASTKTLLNSSNLGIDNGKDSTVDQHSISDHIDQGLSANDKIFLPFGIVMQIFSYLCPSDLSKCSTVNHFWRKTAMSPKHWKLYCLSSGAFSNPNDEDLFSKHSEFWSEGLRWKTIYYENRIRTNNWISGKYTKRLIDALDPTDAITCFALDSGRLIIGSRDRRLQLSQVDTPDFWHADNQKLDPKTQFDGHHQNPIMCIGYSEIIQSIIVSADTSGELVFWNAFTGQFLASIKNANKGGVSSICVVDANHIVCAGFDKLVRLYRLMPAEVDDSQPAPMQKTNSSTFSCSSQKSSFVSSLKKGSKDLESTQDTFQEYSKPEILRPTSGSRLWHRHSFTQSESEPTSRPESINSDCLVESRPCKSKLRFGWRKKSILTTKQNIVLVHEMKGHKGDIYCLALLDAGSRLASGSTDQTIKIWNTRGGNCIMTLKGHDQAVTCLKPSEQFLFSGSLDRTIRKWNLKTGACLQVITGHTEWIKTMDITRNYLISGGWDETLFIWNLEKGTLVHKIVLDMGPILSLYCNSSRIVAAMRDPRYQHMLISIDFSSPRPDFTDIQVCSSPTAMSCSTTVADSPTSTLQFFRPPLPPKLSSLTLSRSGLLNSSLSKVSK